MAVPVPLVNRFTALVVEPLAEALCDSGTAQRVPPGLRMGDEEFQLRAFMIGDPPFDQNEAGVAVANWGIDEGRGAYSLLNNLGKVSFAQAEFYFDGTSNREEWLWELNWKARLRRFRLPGGGLGGLTSLCPPSVCSSLLGIDLENIVVH
jgi:hypothetical protein